MADFKSQGGQAIKRLAKVKRILHELMTNVSSRPHKGIGAAFVASLLVELPQGFGDEGRRKNVI
jgi:hypothetical protein